ncbi:MAG: MFS transporter [Bacteroidota bacterium]|nr:MFS transporter [Bacteroidota bacterium]
MNNPGKDDAFAVLKIRDFRLFIGFRFFMTIAIQMQSLIVGWQIYELTHNPLSLGLIGLSEAIPFISIALYAGNVADRFPRKNILLMFEAFFLIGTTALLLFSFPKFGILALLGVLPIYLVVTISGFTRAFLYPAAIAMMAQLVPRNLYTNSATWNSTSFHIAAIAGPSIGGLVYGFFGVSAAYISVIVFMALSFILLIIIRKQPVPPVTHEETLRQRLGSGIRFVMKNQILLSAMSLDMFAVLFGGAVAMLPVFADVILHVGPKGLGFLRAAPMVGAVMMSIFLAYHPPRVHAGRSLLIGVTGFGLSIICFALSHNFYLSFGLLILSGMFDNISVVIRASAMQLITPDDMRGRVASVNSIFIGSSNEIGSFESGLAAKIMGLIPSVLFGGGMTLLIVMITGKWAPLLRKMDLSRLGDTTYSSDEK